MYNAEVQKIISYIYAGHPLFYIQHSDFFAVREIIKEVKEKFKKDFFDYKFYEYTNAFGSRVEYGEPFDSDEIEIEDEYSEDFENWLYTKSQDKTPKFLVLKDIVTNDLSSMAVSFIKEMAEETIDNEENGTIIVIAESKPVPFPKELESIITIIDVNPLCDEDIKATIENFVKKNGLKRGFIDNTQMFSEFAYQFRGLQQNQIERILGIAVVNDKNNELKNDNEQKKNILEEKEQIIKKSGILELVINSSDFKKIGGLGPLKNWLEDKKLIYEDIVKAKAFGVAKPKGILLVGMPGCGKSLAAKATATLFNVPLVRLDVGSLLGMYVGESEHNMIKALSLSDSFSPCVLWIDEIEKAFAGINTSGKSDGSEVVSRIFGQFLTWMQEKDNEVFIVATANDIEAMPPELLRKGRFDELFFVDLPSLNGRKEIFKLKFESKNQDLNQVDLDKLAKETEGYSGSDIEDIVNTAIEKKYIAIKRSKNMTPTLTTDFIIDILSGKKSISKMLDNKIEYLKEQYKKLDLIPASD